MSFFLIDAGLRLVGPALGVLSAADAASLPLLGAISALFGLLTMPAGNAYSRWRERRADRFALDITGNPQAFIGAMTRLANQNLAHVDPEPWVVWLLYSHPRSVSGLPWRKRKISRNGSPRGRPPLLFAA